MSQTPVVDDVESAMTTKTYSVSFFPIYCSSLFFFCLLRRIQQRNVCLAVDKNRMQRDIYRVSAAAALHTSTDRFSTEKHYREPDDALTLGSCAMRSTTSGVCVSVFGPLYPTHGQQWFLQSNLYRNESKKTHRGRVMLTITVYITLKAVAAAAAACVSVCVDCRAIAAVPERRRVKKRDKSAKENCFLLCFLFYFRLKNHS